MMTKLQHVMKQHLTLDLEKVSYIQRVLFCGFGVFVS